MFVLGSEQACLMDVQELRPTLPGGEHWHEFIGITDGFM